MGIIYTLMAMNMKVNSLMGFPKGKVLCVLLIMTDMKEIGKKGK